MHPAADTLRRLAGLPDDWVPAVAIVLGSGLGGTADRLLDDTDFPRDACCRFAEVNAGSLPGLTASHVPGHRGQFVAGLVDHLPVLFQQGRIHAYEGHSTDVITATVRLFAALGTRTLILTNAAGGINANFRPGDLMLIRDHIRMPASLTAACGSQSVAVRNRPQSPWTESLLEIALSTPGRIRVHAGTYALMPGPAYETPAEVRMLRTLGADAVGMSTVPEAVQAAALGMQVLGVSCITNVAAGLQNRPLSHVEVTDTGRRIEGTFAAWLREVLSCLTAGKPRENGTPPGTSPTDPDS
ncbi:MAG: purine-nucleoside phosphorylase [Planctomycetota bacterium]